MRATAYERVGDQRKLDRRSTRFRDLAYQAIKDSILNGIVGVELPLIEERLAEALQISRTPVREALAILEHEGLIEALPYKGLYVKAISIDEFVLLREAVATILVTLARQAAQSVSTAEIATMSIQLERAAHCIPQDIPGHLAACRAFLAQVGSSCPSATAVMINLAERADLYVLRVRPLYSNEPLRATVAALRAILQAIADGAADAAGHAAEAYVRSLRAYWAVTAHSAASPA